MSDQPFLFARPPAEPEAGASCHCTTCGDVAEPMLVLQLDTARELALCEDGGGAHHTVETALVEPVAAGESLLVHAGTAIARAGEASP